MLLIALTVATREHMMHLSLLLGVGAQGLTLVCYRGRVESIFFVFIHGQLEPVVILSNTEAASLEHLHKCRHVSHYLYTRRFSAIGFGTKEFG